jgi:hypothetical protein
MRAPVEGSGADAGRLTHWSQPGGGTSSSGISTAAAWLSSIGAGAGGTDDAMTAVVMAADGAATACCDFVVAAALRGPSLVAVAVLLAARDALDERRPEGTAASDLYTFAGARGAQWAPPCEHENEKSGTSHSKTWHLGECSLTLGWRSPASSYLGARRALWRRPTLPPPRPQSPLRRALAPQWCTSAPPRRARVPPRRASPPSRAAWRRVLPRPPQALSPMPPPRLLARGRRLPPLGESSSPIALLLLLVRRRVL